MNKKLHLVQSQKRGNVIAGGCLHSLALTSNGTVYVWGWNEDGQLGNGSSDYYSNTPLKVSGL
ncbi:MAG TPA: RCC1 domain-containing protein [Bacillota bacterium]